MMQKTMVMVAAVLLGVAGWVTAQDEPPAASPARLFEAGDYEAVANQVKGRVEAGGAPAEDLFWAGQSLRRLDRAGEAVELFRRIGGEDDQDPWLHVGRSAAALAEGQREQAVQEAARAAELAPDLFFAHYQLGLARSEMQQWPQAVTALERATELDGSAAYGHYYAGMAYNKTRRMDRMASHLARFLELAPNAPEREQVQQVLRLMKGIR